MTTAMGDYRYTVAGKAVQFKRRVPLAEHRNLAALLKATDGGDLGSQVALISTLIESWEFDGNPSDTDAYDTLDIFSELLPLVRVAGQYIQARTAAIAPKD